MPEIRMKTIVFLNCLVFTFGINSSVDKFIEEDGLSREKPLEQSWDKQEFIRSHRLVEHKSDGIYVLRARRSVKVNFKSPSFVSENDEETSGIIPTPDTMSTTSRPNTEIKCESMKLSKNKDGQCVQANATFNVTMRILKNFISGYSVRTSMEFKNLSKRIINVVDKAYKNNRNYLTTYITSFTNGSVIVSMQLLFESAQSTPLNELKSGIEEGLFGNLQIDKESIAIIFGDSCLDKPCSPNGQCEDLSDGQYNCTCNENLSGNGTFCEGRIKVNATITVQQTYTEELKNRSSPEYIRITTTFAAELVQVFENQKNFVGIEILSLSNGSIKVDFLVIYRSQNPSKRIIEVKLVTETLQREGSGGSIRNLVLVKGGILIREPPPPPENISSGEIKETQISVNWDPPKFSKLFSIQSYLISYRAGNASNFQTKQTIISNRLNGKLDNLESDTFYEIFIRGKNEHGEGENSKSVRIKTKKAKENHTILIAVITVAIVISVVLIFIIGYLIVKRKRKVAFRMKKDRRTLAESREVALPFSDRPHPSDWRNLPLPGSFRRSLDYPNNQETLEEDESVENNRNV